MSNARSDKKETLVHSTGALELIGSDMSLMIMPTMATPQSAARFERFVSGMDKWIGSLSKPLRLLTCMVCCDGLLTKTSLTAMTKLSTSARRHDQEVYVSWTEDDNHLQRRYLSSRTIIALRDVPHDTNWDNEIQSFTSVLSDHYPNAQKWQRKELWEKVFEDAVAWLYLICPRQTLAFATGNLQYSLLSDCVLERANGSPMPVMQIDSPVIDDLGPSHDAALDMLLDTEVEGARNAKLLGEIKGILTQSGSNRDVRVTDHKWRAQVQSKLAIVTDLLTSQGTTTDAFLLGWVHFLLTTGSVRLENPTVTTIGRYFTAVANCISDQLAVIDSSPFDFTAKNWEELFCQLTDQLSTDVEGPAIASCHQYCIATFGIDPQPKILFKSSRKSQPTANVIWPHETDQLLLSCQRVSTDVRVVQSVQVMVALATAIPLRIGELHSLRLRDVSVKDGVLIVHFAPARSDHQGKSDAARRIMTGTNPALVEIVERWILRRHNEGDSDCSYLFGDPHSPARTYRFGLCARLLNQLLRSVTGDDGVSFHTLRHSWVTGRILAALDKTEEHSSVSRVQQLSVQTGHNNVATTLIHYFHQPDLALRRAIDRQRQKLQVTSRAMAYWTGTTSSALRKAKQRSVGKRGFYCAHLHAFAMTQYSLKTVPLIAATQSTPNGIPFNLVRKALSDIQLGFSSCAIESRCSISAEDLLTICQCAAEQIHTMDQKARGHRAVPLSPHAHKDHALQWVRDGLQRHDLACALACEPLLLTLSTQLDRACSPNQLHHRAAKVWLNSKSGSVLDMTQAEFAKPLVELLHQANFPGSALLLRSHCVDIKSKHALLNLLVSPAVQQAKLQVESVINVPLRVEAVAPRRGQPSTYLLLARSTITKNAATPAAMLRMSGFHGLIFTMATWCHQQCNMGATK